MLSKSLFLERPFGDSLQAWRLVILGEMAPLKLYFGVNKGLERDLGEFLHLSIFTVKSKVK